MKKPARRQQSRPAPAAASVLPRRGWKWWQWALCAAALLFLVFEVYAPALGGPFLFDDVYLPFAMPGVEKLSFTDWLQGVRPMLMLTFWMNYNLSGTQPLSYHVFNLLFHLINAILLFFLVRRLLSRAGESGFTRDFLAAFAGAVFLLHPVQTESVAYVASRSESLSLLFFFAAFAAFLYRRSEAIGFGSSAIVVLLFGCALLVKEHAAVLPVLLLLTDYYWNQPPFSLQGIRRNWRLYVPIMVLTVGGGVFVWGVLQAADTAGFRVEGLTWYEYFFTQWRAIWVYIRLFVLPFGQSLDYAYPISRTPLDHGAILGLVGLLLLAGAAIYYRRRFPLASYGFFAFLILLAPTSSLVPIKDPLAERRLYLPMIGLLLILVDLLRRLRISRVQLAAGCAAVLVVLSVLTYQRNIVWSDPILLWQDTVAKSPHNSRAHFQLAYAYYQSGRCAESVRAYEETAQLTKPDYRLLVDWALAYDCNNQPAEALAHLEQAAALEKSAHVYSLIGMVHAKQKRYPEAMTALDTAIHLDPNYSMTYVYRGNIHALQGEYRKAVEEYRRALAADPSNQPAREALAVAESNLKQDF